LATAKWFVHEGAFVFIARRRDREPRAAGNDVGTSVTKGLAQTGPDLSADDLTAFGWPLKRQPYVLETSRQACSLSAMSEPET
jgi:hypothetical protein